MHLNSSVPPILRLLRIAFVTASSIASEHVLEPGCGPRTAPGQPQQDLRPILALSRIVGVRRQIYLTSNPDIEADCDQVARKTFEILPVGSNDWKQDDPHESRTGIRIPGYEMARSDAVHRAVL
jgi:hypothetical protein